MDTDAPTETRGLDRFLRLFAEALVHESELARDDPNPAALPLPMPIGLNGSLMRVDLAALDPRATTSSRQEQY